MKISQMEYFTAVCRLGSITQAARELHISQPSITAAIHEMEKELEVNLFLRRNNRLHLTEEGGFVLDRVSEILRNMERLDRDLKGFVGKKNMIRLGLPLQIGAFLLREAVRMDGAIRAIPMNKPMKAQIGVATKRGTRLYSDSKSLLSFIKKEFAT